MVVHASIQAYGLPEISVIVVQWFPDISPLLFDECGSISTERSLAVVAKFMLVGDVGESGVATRVSLRRLRLCLDRVHI